MNEQIGLKILILIKKGQALRDMLCSVDCEGRTVKSQIKSEQICVWTSEKGLCVEQIIFHSFQVSLIPYV